MEYQQSKVKSSILISIPILFVLSGPMHFLFEFTGKLAFIGAIAPVNESPWEHLKLVFYPILVWWIIFYSYTGAFGVEILALAVGQCLAYHLYKFISITLITEKAATTALTGLL